MADTEATRPVAGGVVDTDEHTRKHATRVGAESTHTDKIIPAATHSHTRTHAFVSLGHAYAHATDTGNFSRELLFSYVLRCEAGEYNGSDK